jgi:small-conductance mechanosensitive channel
MDLSMDFYVELFYAGAAVLAAVGLIVALQYLVIPGLRKWTDRTATDLDGLVLKVISLPLYLCLLVLGFYIGLLQFTAIDSRIERLQQVVSLAFLALLFFALIRLVDALLARHINRVQQTAEGSVNPTLILIRKLVALTLFGLLITLVLGQLGYRLTPVLTSLGIAGVAIAIGLQDTLGNLFAGFYLLFDQPLKVGDYVRLDSGEEGFVTEIGWRSTKIRPWANNIIIVPNNKLAQSIIVNHHLPEPRQRVYVNCGVAYQSDLEHVEQVCLEVGKEVMAQVEGSDLEWEPLVRFKEFGDSNINFQLILQIKEFGAQYVLAHECMKALHRRFKQEGIEISWPVRKLVAASSFELTSPPPEPPVTGRLG